MTIRTLRAIRLGSPSITHRCIRSTPAHCILSGAARVVLESLGQPMPELSLTSPTAPGVTHHWSNLDGFTTEVANARIWAGFHYRFSTRVGTALGGQVSQYVANKVMQPVNRTAQR